MKLQDKIMIVTGGGSGIGQTIAVRAAEQGAKVVIVGRSEGPLQETSNMHQNISYVVGDVSKTEDVTKLIQYVTNTFGQLDVVVNNAGVAPVVPLEAQTLEEFDRVFNINVRAVVDIAKQALPLLKASKGNIVNISSAVANNPLANMSVYSASKAAMDTLTIVWAKELAKDGIRVNSVAVGPIETPIYEKTALSEEEKQAHEENVKRIVPLGRFGSTDEVANVVNFLASEDAGYVTGSNYAVDGGFGI